ncbi:MAG: sugar transferase [Bacteroidota bacterium]
MSFRIRDVIVAGIALIFILPVMLGLTLALWVTQGGPFFKQLRPGLKGKEFYILKFRKLMRTEDGKLAYTKMGRWMERTSLDELPQLINVLKGDMSLVGPRPLLMEYLELYSPEEKRRHDVRPGITGWAQVHGRSTISFKQRFQLDLWYVENRSHLLDLKIMWQTLALVVAPPSNADADANDDYRYDGTN